MLGISTAQTNDASLSIALISTCIWRCHPLVCVPGLLDKLAGERERWGSQVEGLAASLKSLPLEALLAAAAVVHLGSRPESARTEMMTEWAG
jgi:hypothetical protein